MLHGLLLRPYGKKDMRYVFGLIIVTAVFVVSCTHDPIFVHDIVYVDTSGNGGGCGTAVGLYASSIASTSVTLNWSAVNGATSYNVQYRVVGNGIWTPATASTSSLPLSGLIANTSYEFQVQTICSSGSSAFSGSATFLTDTSGGGTTGIPCDPDTAYFQNDVLPIFISNCAKPGCHDAQSHEEGLVLDSYDNIMATDKIKPGDPNDSKIYKVLIDNDPDDKMPPPGNTPLTSDQINLIYTWILQGAKDNYCGGGACDTSNVTFSGSVNPILQNNCVGCHSGSVLSGGVDLSSYNAVYTQAANGNLKGSINGYPGYTVMPLGGQLSECDINQINFWINDGAPNN